MGECAACRKQGNFFHLRSVHISTHIQGVGQVVAPAIIDNKKVQIQLCEECSSKLVGMIPNAVEEYHLGAV